MSNETNSDEIPVEVLSENETDSSNKIEEFDNVDKNDDTSEDLSKLLELEKQKTLQFEEKLKHVLADFQNLSRKTQNDIETGVNSKINEFILDFLKIYDDFIRAKEVISESKINADGLNSILKNMESLMEKYNVKPIDALGEIFDPNFHEAISIISDPSLDDNTITKEIRKGYISHEKILRPTLVEISKKENDDKK
ncbi:MAG: nucleotide exchange factor GrpE [Nitrosopumilus sp.]|uniref:Protein GrpE n=1 Tax=Candidatus Nitrosomarinus catalinensis TaxID=1898749 RepID=A0A2Z2HHN2_9ARCH|nr:nucleotide exchange factor GrpE [Candidatus Nitrosomarinus catalina]ARS63732.1 heat shock protein GrpE [Candidatus Nitrosomarinus catalina]MBA4447315.1 nucleotide exchange factor GrpE [Nitrosopumilaceae archaeon]